MPYEIIKWTKDSEPSGEELQLMFKNRNLDFYGFSNRSGYRYAGHSHDYDKFLVMAKGTMNWIIEGKEEILGAGDAVILPKGTIHEVLVLSDCECLEAHF